ncbi:MAG TPA: AsmA family protein [Terriglobales bacterium]|nr:AsmA family protein [Terriglobales bacterium]
MSLRSRRARVYVAIVITLALGFLVPPSINLNQYRVRLSESLSRSLGRQVSIQDVRLRLLPLPGFTFRQLRISDSDEFGAEPILQTGGEQSEATLRLTSLWRGRLEIASLSLTQASLNLVRCADGHWNLERLINRAAQVPSAPTTKKQPEARARFPYVETKESRINFKFGAEKKPFTLSDAEFALWLPTENRWNVRLQAIPLRTDESISDTGVIRISGSFDRASQFADTPFHLQASWEHPEINAITQIARGSDPGWRGAVDLHAELKGTPADFTAKLDANIDELRRYDIARTAPFNLRVNCENRFRAQVMESNAIHQLDFNCKAPFDSGLLTAEGEVHPLGSSADFSVRLVASELPVSVFLRALLHAKSSLPDDLNGNGIIDGSWSLERAGASPVVWKGTLTATRATLRSRVLEPELIFPRALVVNFEPPEVTAPSKSFRRDTAPMFSRAVLQPVVVNLGGDANFSAVFDPYGYSFSLNGAMDWRRVLQAARAIGLHPPQTDLRGSGVLEAQYFGEWHQFAPPAVVAQAQIRSATLSLRGFSEPLRISSGIVHFDGETFRAEKLTGNFPRSRFEFLGAFSGSRKCERYLFCNVSFSLEIPDLRESTLRDLLIVRNSQMTLPFFNSGRQFDARWLFEVPASGTIAAQHLTVQKLHADTVNARLEITAGKLLVHRWTAELFGGKYSGEWAFDLSGDRPAISTEGKIQRLRLDELNAALDQHVGTGTVDVAYRLSMNGTTADQLASTATGSGTFLWRNGEIHTTLADNDRVKPVAFTAWAGHFNLARQRIALENTNMASATGIQQVSGEVSFNREWNLKLASANPSRVVAAGTKASSVSGSDSAKLAEAR